MAQAQEEPLAANPDDPAIAVAQVHAEASGEGATGGAVAPGGYPLDEDEPEDDEEEEEDDNDDDDDDDQDMEALLEEEEKKKDADFEDMISQQMQAGNIKMKVRSQSRG